MCLCEHLQGPVFKWGGCELGRFFGSVFLVNHPRVIVHRNLGVHNPGCFCGGEACLPAFGKNFLEECAVFATYDLKISLTCIIKPSLR